MVGMVGTGNGGEGWSRVGHGGNGGSCCGVLGSSVKGGNGGCNVGNGGMLRNGEMVGKVGDGGSWWVMVGNGG